MKKIHWFHDYKSDGWEEWGWLTIWKGKCDCGAKVKSSDINKARGKQIALIPVFTTILFMGLLFGILATMYINGITPFNY